VQGELATAALALATAPVAWLQGRELRRRTPRLPEAPGPRSGSIQGSEPVLRVIGLGESPMAAVGLADQSEALLPLLASNLNRSTGRRVAWATAARSGATAAVTRRELLPRLDPFRSDLVVIALGVNDCLALRSPRRWRSDLAALITAVRDRLSAGTILVAGIPPMQRFPALSPPLSILLGTRARLLNAVSARLAAASPDVVHVPMQLAGPAEAFFCRDGFHPSARGHAAWARQLAAAGAAPLAHQPGGISH